MTAEAKTSCASETTVAPVPANMAWVSVYLATKDPAAAIEWYEKALGFQKKLAMPGDDGKIQHAELTYQDSTIMLGPECPEKGGRAPSTLGGTPVIFYVYSQCVDTLAERVREHGGVILEEPKDQFWGDRTFLFRDPEGYAWMFAKRQREFNPNAAGEGCCG